MTALPEMPFNRELDLRPVRVVDVAPALVWEAYTTPELLLRCFCSKPWKVSAYVIELRSDGRVSPTRRSPEGVEFPSESGGAFNHLMQHGRLSAGVTKCGVGRIGRPGLSTEQRLELSARWRAGESLSVSGLVLGRHAGVIHSVVASQGG